MGAVAAITWSAMSTHDIVWLHDLTVDTRGRFTMRPVIYSDVRSRCNLMLLAHINQAHLPLGLISTVPPDL